LVWCEALVEGAKGLIYTRVVGSAVGQCGNISMREVVRQKANIAFIIKGIKPSECGQGAVNLGQYKLDYL
jgi:hypothetical protein